MPGLPSKCSFNRRGEIMAVAGFSHVYNAGSEISSYTGPDGTLNYTYEKAGQLTAVSGAHSESFGFDANGNRNTTGYTTTTGNEMTKDAAGNMMTFDKNGNLATKTDSAGNVWTYTFDFHNHMTQVVEKNSGGTTILTENLTYDVVGNWIGVKVNGTQQRWTVFDGVNPYLDFNGSGSLTQRLLSNPQAIDAFFATVSASNSINWLFTDNLGSIREVVSTTGSVLDQITYYAFGGILNQTNSPNAPRLLFAGGEWDSNLGLYRFGARWYDPVDGRWVSQDPLGLAPDSNPYRFVTNQPTRFTDPLGLQQGAQQQQAQQWLINYVALLLIQIKILEMGINNLLDQIRQIDDQIDQIRRALPFFIAGGAIRQLVAVQAQIIRDIAVFESQMAALWEKITPILNGLDGQTRHRLLDNFPGAIPANINP